MLGWAVGLGAAVGLVQALRQAPPALRESLPEATVWAVLGLVWGGRAAYVWAHAGAFWQRPWAVLMPWEGGAAWPGAALGFALGLAWAAYRLRQPLALLSDALLPLAAGMVFGAWLGCAVEGCFYGPLWPGGMKLPDEWGQMAPRWPLQLLGLLGSGAVFIWVERVQRRQAHPGRATAAAWLGGGLLMTALTLLRADPRPYLGPLPAETWMALAFALVGGVVWIGWLPRSARS